MAVIWECENRIQSKVEGQIKKTFTEHGIRFGDTDVHNVYSVEYESFS